MSNRKALKGAIAAIASVATLGALAAPALANETSTYNLNGKSVAELAQHGGECAGKTVWEQAKEMGYQTVENDPAAIAMIVKTAKISR